MSKTGMASIPDALPPPDGFPAGRKVFDRRECHAGGELNSAPRLCQRRRALPGCGDGSPPQERRAALLPRPARLVSLETPR